MFLLLRKVHQEKIRPNLPRCLLVLIEFIVISRLKDLSINRTTDKCEILVETKLRVNDSEEKEEKSEKGEK